MKAHNFSWKKSGGMIAYRVKIEPEVYVYSCVEELVLSTEGMAIRPLLSEWNQHRPRATVKITCTVTDDVQVWNIEEVNDE